MRAGIPYSFFSFFAFAAPEAGWEARVGEIAAEDIRAAVEVSNRVTRSKKKAHRFFILANLAHVWRHWALPLNLRPFILAPRRELVSVACVLLAIVV